MTKQHWSKFFWADWESDEGLRQCSLAAQGLWMRMLCICAKGEPHGYLSIRGEPLDATGVVRAVGHPEAEVVTLIAELERWGVFSRDRSGRIFSRRLVRDAEKSRIATKHGKQGGNPSLLNPTLNPDDNPSLASGSWHLEFEKWYERYPHKIGRGAAEKSFLRARETASLESLCKGLEHYIASKPADRPWCNPATWLNQQRWLDRPADGGPAQASQENIERTWTSLLEREARDGQWTSTRVQKSDIPADFITRWQSTRQMQQEAAE